MHIPLIRWQELNALRGLYLAETSQIEVNLMGYLNTFEKIQLQCTYNYNSNKHSSLSTKEKKQLEKFLQGRPVRFKFSLFHCQIMLFRHDSSEFELFDEIRILRNGFAHINEQTINNEVSIRLNDGTVIKESDIKEYRKKLLSFVDLIEENKTSSNEIVTVSV